MKSAPRLGQSRQFGAEIESGKIVYLLDANFTRMADASAPLPSPLAVDVGELTLVQNDGQFSIANGAFVFPAQSTPGWGAQYAVESGGVARASGVALLQKITRSEATTVEWHGFNGDNTPASYTAADLYIYPITSGNMYIGDDVNLWPVNTYSATEYTFIVIATNGGGSCFIKGGTFTDWTNLGTLRESAATTLYAAFCNLSANGSMSLMRLASLADNATYPVPALGTRDLDLCTPGTGTGTSSIAAPINGDKYLHTADTVVTFDLSGAPPVANVIVYLRNVNDANYSTASIRFLCGGGTASWSLADLDSSHTIMSGGGIAAGKITILANNDLYKIWLDGTLLGSASYSGNLDAGTFGQIANTGAVLTNLTAKTLDGVANAASSNHPGYGLATDVLPGPRSAGDTFTHEADCVWEWQLDALPSAGNVFIFFRMQDSSNYWQIYIDTAGNYRLREVVSGSPTLRAGVTALVGGERITIIANGTTIKGYYDTTLAWTYASATNFQTETSGKVNSLGTGGRASNIITWPLDLAAAPNTPEAYNIDQILTRMATP